MVSMRTWLVAIFLGLGLASTGTATGAAPRDFGQIKAPTVPLVLVDQVGYDLAAPRRALVQGFGAVAFTRFRVVNVTTGKTVLDGAHGVVGRCRAGMTCT